MQTLFRGNSLASKIMTFCFKVNVQFALRLCLNTSKRQIISEDYVCGFCGVVNSFNLREFNFKFICNLITLIRWCFAMYSFKVVMYFDFKANGYSSLLGVRGSVSTEASWTFVKGGSHNPRTHQFWGWSHKVKHLLVILFYFMVIIFQVYIHWNSAYAQNIKLPYHLLRSCLLNVIWWCKSRVHNRPSGLICTNQVQ